MTEHALPGQHELTMTVLMTPDMANFSGKVHGGAILKKLGEVAYACASRYSGHYVVTLSVDQVRFKQPIHVGELVTFLASINHVGRSSMEVGIKVVAAGDDATSSTARPGIAVAKPIRDVATRPMRSAMVPMKMAPTLSSTRI